MISQPLVTGSVVKIWQENRGHDYVILGIRGTSGNRKLGLLRNTCINNDGEIHAATNKIHKWVDVEQLDEFNTAIRVKRVEGSREVSREGIRNFVRCRVGDTAIRALKDTDEVYPELHAVDARSASMYV
jgi:hypothetical protein